MCVIQKGPPNMYDVLQIMIPYENDGHLTNRQRAHNYTLSSARSSIERSFGLLRGKFRRLKSLPSYRLEYSVDHIVASMVLHNFILLVGETAVSRPCHQVIDLIRNETY